MQVNVVHVIIPSRNIRSLVGLGTVLLLLKAKNILPVPVRYVSVRISSTHLDDNVRKLYEKVEDDDCQFILRDLKTGEARSVSWSSVKDTLDLFCHKSWNFLWRAEYMPPPLKQELRQEAVAQGLIKGVASDFGMQSTRALVGVE